MKVAELAARLGLPFEGDGSVEVVRCAGIDDARAGDITFLRDPKQAARALSTGASAIVLPAGVPAGAVPVLRAPDAGLAFLGVVAILHPRPRPVPGVHPTAVVAASAKVGAGASIGAFVFVDEDVEIGAGCELRSHVAVHRGARLGDGCVLHSFAVVREGVTLGARVVLQDGAVIGADGFGFAKRPDGSYAKIPHVGTVVIEDDVEIQANACVDRATLGETRVGRGTKIDNLVQVAHNCRIGEHSILCGQVGLAGSTTLGKGVTLAGQVGTGDHSRVGDGATALAQAGIPSEVAAGAVVAGTPAIDARTYMRFITSTERFLDLLKEVRDHGKRLAALEGGRGA
ncbi:MAG: UDP-3-O-(3-hydroxymyristoyl)glucosamine N-acyltransferase [Planctomycetes bacterium]|nr:UDP-3-O-(3-hydroxymyristoyl)glucosamine N-acyltransferase [Planctomycetota bacterium]